MNKETKELKNIRKAINAYIKKHKNEVAIAIDVMAFDEKTRVVDDLMGFYGPKKVIKLQLNEMRKEITKDKSAFINW